MEASQQRFVADTLDLLSELDEGLLQLEVNPMATAPLEQVFRTMHTIKGGANMFGFENIGNLAHELETIFDLVRQKKVQINDSLISLTLHAFDKVRDLLKEKDQAKMTDPSSLVEYEQRAHEYLVAADIQENSVNDSSGGTKTKDELATFLIRIIPTLTITADGNHPLVFIIPDIETLGTSQTKLYHGKSNEILQWDIFLSTTGTKEEIESYFIFVESDCRVEIYKLDTTDLLSSEIFKSFITSLPETPATWSTIKSFVDEVAQPGVTSVEVKEKPKEAIRIGAASQVLSLQEMPHHVLRFF